MNDLFTYPEGWNKMIKELDFLPDDDKARNEFLAGYLAMAFILW
jgi:uncharacterized protein YjeT (DUF2065 family)